MKILITGSSGFVGTAVCRKLPAASLTVVSREKPKHRDCKQVDLLIDDHTDFTEALKHCDIVIHCAAKVPGRARPTEDSDAFRKVNTLGTLNLARQAAASGVKRFIFLSSIKVNGERTAQGTFFRHDDKPCPEGPYASSKADAEAGLRVIAHETRMEVVIIRPPLVYGPGVKGNVARLMKLAQMSIPVPLGGIENKRSLVAIDNLVDLIVTCVHHPKAANETFLVSDKRDLSTTEFFGFLASVVGTRPRLFKIPGWVVKAIAWTGRGSSLTDSLWANLQIDTSHTRSTLDWSPPFTMDQIKLPMSLSSENKKGVCPTIKKGANHR